jgi:NADPH:quinone reductase-like Zn-dependent oxidoreductase
MTRLQRRRRSAPTRSSITAREQVNQRVRELTHRRGVDVVIEHIGPEVWTQCIDALAKGGRLITCGATTGAEVKAGSPVCLFEAAHDPWLVHGVAE